MGKGAAVITGAAGGIGSGLARHAAAVGYDLVLVDLDEARLATLAEELGGEVEVMTSGTSVADGVALDVLAGQVAERFGAPTLLFANAGIEMAGNTWELSAAQWDRMIDVNIRGVVQTVRAFTAGMIAAERPAHVALVSSLAGLSMFPVKTPYIVSKHAVVSLAENLSLELQRLAPQVKVSVVCPGPVDTEIVVNTTLAEGSSDAVGHRDRMNAMVRGSGMTGDRAAELILEQVLAGRFWVSPHPEMLQERAAARGRYLLDLAEPTYAPAMEQLLGSR